MDTLKSIGGMCTSIMLLLKFEHLCFAVFIFMLHLCILCTLVWLNNLIWFIFLVLNWAYIDTRGTSNGNEFMRKQELIDAAEASGLSRVAIGYVYITSLDLCVFLDKVLKIHFWPSWFYTFRPEKGRGKPGNFGSSPRDWYSGWNCMKTLITKGLVVKSSCPAK